MAPQAQPLVGAPGESDPYLGKHCDRELEPRVPFPVSVDIQPVSCGVQ